MEKSAGRHYHYDSYHTQTQQQKNGKSSPAPKRRRDARCLCLSERGATLAQGFFSNVGICTLLLGYTLLGAFVFLAIEGGGVAGAARPGGAERRLHNGNSSWLQRAADESRARTVENIWEITVSLNILYRDNWTRLAAQEIARFQEQLVARMGEEATVRQQTGASPQHHRRPQYEWNFARAFLYSLTVLTTIGK